MAAKKEKARQLVEARVEQLGAAAFRAALTDFLIEARKTLQVVKVAALAHAAVQFNLMANGSSSWSGEADHINLTEAARRCSDEARAQLGHVTG